MTLKVKKDGAWKEASSLKVKINGEWKDVSTLYSKKDGAWVTVYSSGALITFSNYPYPIPVAKGWKYSTDKVNWTTVTSDSTINDSGTFTGFVKVSGELNLNNWYISMTPSSFDLQMNPNEMSYGHTYGTNFVLGEYGYVCGGHTKNEDMPSYNTYVTSGVHRIDLSGNAKYLGSMSRSKMHMSSFTVGDKGYICGGYYFNETIGYYTTDDVDVYDLSGNRTSGTKLAYPLYASEGIYFGGYGYNISGATINSSNSGSINGRYGAGLVRSLIEKYDSSGNKSTATSLSKARHRSGVFVLENKLFVCGGGDWSSNRFENYMFKIVDIFDTSGVRTTGTDITNLVLDFMYFSNNGKGYVTGGYSVNPNTNNTITYKNTDVYNASGVKTTGTALSVARIRNTSFVLGGKGFVTGNPKTTEVFNADGTKTMGISLNYTRKSMLSFVNSDIAFIHSGISSEWGSSSVACKLVEMYKYNPEKYQAEIPITEGSTYTLNGESGVADVSKVMEFDTRVSGTIKYKEGDMSPSVRITVVDESGNVVEGATVSITEV